MEYFKKKKCPVPGKMDSYLKIYIKINFEKIKYLNVNKNYK